MRTLMIVAAALALAGCATGSPPTSRVSGLDVYRVVTVPGHGNACSGVVCTGLGAQWSSATPDHALLVVYVFNDVRAITGVSLSVGGRVHRCHDRRAMMPHRDRAQNRTVNARYWWAIAMLNRCSAVIR